MGADEKDVGGTQYDAPNQEVVGVEPPWVEGSGGVPPEPEAAHKSQRRVPRKAGDEAEREAEAKDDK